MQDPSIRNDVSGTNNINTLIQAGKVVYGQAPSGNQDAPFDQSDWESRVRRSISWSHIPSGRDEGLYRSQISHAAGLLQRRCQTLQSELEADPWQDPLSPIRFLERIEWLLGEPDPKNPLDIYPAEVSLLALIPFLHRTQYLYAASRAVKVDPGNLQPKEEADGDRKSFESFAAQYDTLSQRALLQPKSERSIGWWIFHRWLPQRDDYSEPQVIADLLSTIKDTTEFSGETFSPDRIVKLLRAIQRGSDVCNREHLATLSIRDHVRAPGYQEICEQRLALLFSLAYRTSLEMASLPSIISEHVGIPHEVDLSKLRETVETATWGGRRDFPVLRASCHHEAVIEGLREDVARSDHLLHAVHRVLKDRRPEDVFPLSATRLSGDDIEPANGSFSGWAAFRHDGDRIRELLSGIQLYKDQSLAVRELYQNSLDACRYRLARTEFLNRSPYASYFYSGKILFLQGIDENGRDYLDCIDNGIGMGEAELRGAFSSAGDRFTEHPDFQLERLNWKQSNPPISFYPNSRFGIGVLSYFMLADEMRIRTCRMGLEGKPGPLLEASICGPRHLFRINTVSEEGEDSGTQIRLYLRKDKLASNPWSCLDALERFLGIAEFETSVHENDRSIKWNPGELKERNEPSDKAFGLYAHGKQIRWDGAPSGAQVIWVENGGAVLVDGLLVHPAPGKGISSSAESGITGAVVNLSGEFSPSQLSADRREILSDLRGTLERLLTDAAASLFTAADPILNVGWLDEISKANVRLTDILAAAVHEGNIRVSGKGSSFGNTQSGWMPADLAMIHPFRRPGHHYQSVPWKWKDGQIPDHVLLWRLLAHRREVTKDLATYCPELSQVGDVLPAVPSDQVFLASSDREGLRVSDFVSAWKELGVTLSYAAERSSELRLHNLDASLIVERDLSLIWKIDGSFIDPADPATAADLIQAAARTKVRIAEVASRWRDYGVTVSDDTLVFAEAFEGSSPMFTELPCPEWLTPGTKVSPGYAVDISTRLGISLSQVREQLEEYGFEVDADGIPDFPSNRTALSLTIGTSLRYSWLDRSDVVPPSNVLLAAAELGIQPAEVVAELSQLGFRVPAFPKNSSLDDLPLFLDKHGLKFGHPIIPPGEYPYGLLTGQDFSNRSITAAARRLTDYGFEMPSGLTNRSNEGVARYLFRSSMGWWWDATNNRKVPYARLITDSMGEGTSVDSLADKFHQLGIPTSCHQIPNGLTFRDVMNLLDPTAEDGYYFARNYEFSLPTIVALSEDYNVGIEQAISWASQLGLVDKPVGRLIRAAIPRVPTLQRRY